MKKIIQLLIVTVILVPFITRAQDSTYFHFGIGGSLNNVWIINQNMYGQAEIDYAYKTGGNIMLTAGYNFTPSMGLRLEPGYSWQGQKYEGDQLVMGTNFSTTRDIKLNYFQLPVLFRFTPGEGDNKFHLMAGPEISFLVSARQDYLRNGQDPEPFYSEILGMEIDPGKEDIKDRYKSIDFMLVVDAGMDIKLAERWFMNLGLRVSYGLTDINAEEWQLENLDGEYDQSHNFIAGLTAGFNFLGRK